MPNALSRVFNAATSGSLTLLMDLDGATVYRTPGVHSPIAPETELENDLITLMQAGNTVIINTGRPEEFVNNLFPRITQQYGTLPFWVSTETGAHIRSNTGDVVFKKAVPDIERLKAAFNQHLNYYPGAFIEDYKTCAITIALQGSLDKQGAYSHMLTVANDIAANLSEINIIPVYKTDDAYIEIVPTGVHKGTATETILDMADLNNSLIVCFGDSSADENMMAVTNDRDGCSVGVGDNAPRIASVHMENYTQSQAWIRRMAKIAQRPDCK